MSVVYDPASFDQSFFTGDVQLVEYFLNDGKKIYLLKAPAPYLFASSAEVTIKMFNS